MSKRFRLDKWGIVPGPPSIRPPFHSTELDDAADYSVEEVAAALLRIPGVRLIHDRQPDWLQWRARCDFGSSFIDVEMTTWDASDGQKGWGGSPVSGSGGPEDLALLYARLHEVLPCAWLHNDDCELHTASSFSASLRTG
jgi:hypothetical protein